MKEAPARISMIMQLTRVAPITLAQNDGQVSDAVPPRDRERAEHAPGGAFGRGRPAHQQRQEHERDQQHAAG